MTNKNFDVFNSWGFEDKSEYTSLRDQKTKSEIKFYAETAEATLETTDKQTFFTNNDDMLYPNNRSVIGMNPMEIVEGKGAVEKEEEVENEETQEEETNDVENPEEEEETNENTENEQAPEEGEEQA